MTEPQGPDKPRKGLRIDPVLEELVLEALGEEDTERAVELFLAARLIRIVREKANRASE